MSSVAAWGNNPTNGFNAFTNQGFPAEQNETPWVPTASAPTAGAPTGGITVVVDTTRWRGQKLPLKTIGVIQIIFGLVFLAFGIGFLVFAPAALYIGFLIFNCLSHFIAGCLSIASPLNNPNSSLVKNSNRVSAISVVATTILLVILLIDFVVDFVYKCSEWDFDCSKVKQRITVITGFLTVFTFFACFSSMVFLGNRSKGCCSEQMESVVSMPPTQLADSSMPTAFQDPAGHQNLSYSEFGATAMHVRNTCSDDPPSYEECVKTDWQ
ncbi:hypothetical protein AMEX_G7439 [Astyanax mexicanus]|uniref:Uncharacterized protein n=1 Tax=Astyanax mexicanus TaxID=7994 RepID=A0A8T2LZI5_ASTMX|nr:hypothetical protein AMEX_G7439 [Astyanax mexicanus]